MSKPMTMNGVNRFLSLLLPVVAACTPLAPHETVSLATPKAAFPTWEEVFAHPTSLRVHAFKTGEVQTGPEVLIEADHPRTPDADKQERWVPSITYLVRHPTEGNLLLDTGVQGECSYGLRPFSWVPCRAFDDKTAVPALRRHGLSPADLRFVMVSHFHGDHAAGLPALDRESPVRVLTTQPEWDDVSGFFRVRLGYITDHLQGRYAVTLLDAKTVVDMPHVGRSWDLFGDGSIWMLGTPGHTQGHVSVLLNATSGPVLLTFDASHLRANFEHQVPPGYTVNREAAVTSLARLKALSDAFPQLRVFYGHEPSQWPDGVFEQTLTPP